MADFNFEDIFEKVTSASKDVFGVVAGRAEQAFDLGKGEYNIVMLEKELVSDYKALGRLCYQIEVGELNRDETVMAAAVDKITEKLHKLEELKKGQEEIKGRDISLKAKDAEKAEPEEAAVPEDSCLMMRFCPECGVGNAPDAKKCTNCGHEF